MERKEVISFVHASNFNRKYERKLCFGHNYGGDEL